jgi:putative acetyltransferase
MNDLSLGLKLARELDLFPTRSRSVAASGSVFTMSSITVVECAPSDARALGLLDALSRELQQITGSDGTANFRVADLESERAVFVLLCDGQVPLGCGSLRPFNSTVCEIKRMYAARRGQGIGARILEELELRAERFDYEKIWLETRKLNTRAVAFYLRHGYRVAPNYGVYVGRDEAICFEKNLRT